MLGVEHYRFGLCASLDSQCSFPDFREKEAVYLTWDCADAKRSVLHVKSKPEYDWRVKKHHERDVTVPRDLIYEITVLPRTSRLVFPREGGEPDCHLLRYIKDAAKRAGLDPDRVWNHKLRASGCTRYFQAGMPLPDVMRLGSWRDVKPAQRCPEKSSISCPHNDLKIQRVLRPATGIKLSTRVG